MGRPFSGKEAKNLLRTHRNILQRIKDASVLPAKYNAMVKNATQEYVAEEVLKLLYNIPIDEINREKRGFRVKTLKENGYENIADIANLSVGDITAIHGIGQESAYEIRKVVESIIAKTKKEAKIRLSTDHQTVRSTALVQALSRQRESKGLVTECQNFTMHETKAINDAIRALKKASGPIKWFFASKTTRRKAVEAYTFLQEALTNDYGQKAQGLVTRIDRMEGRSGKEAWEDFAENSVSFYNELEKISPGVLGNDDRIYGLPEELAKAVQEEPFYSEGLKCELRRYQEWGVKYALHQKRILLGDEMGLGKTIQAIATMVSLRNTGATHFLVVCPASVITNWCREIGKMSDLKVVKIHGDDRTLAYDEWLEQGGVAVTTYETTGNIGLSEDFEIDLVVVDEAHYIKNPKAQRTSNVKEICEHAKGLMFMTGTALENRVDEMIELIRVLQPQIAKQIQEMSFLSTAPQFREKVAPVYYRRKREDVLTELPELTEKEEWCTMTMLEEEVYERAVLEQKYADARRVSWNVEDLKESSKAQRLLDIVEKAEEEGRKIIIFSFFLDTLQKVSSLLGERCMETINGSVSPQRRQEIIDEFDKAPTGSVLVAQIQSGGTGLNIQSASVVVLCEPQFKPSIENQAISRAYRMGQTRNVLVYRLLCEDTVDEKVMDVLENKQKIFDAFADESVVATESLELDEKTFGAIMEEEIERIQTKNGQKV